jgi:hypothetical protein
MRAEVATAILDTEKNLHSLKPPMMPHPLYVLHVSTH